MNKKYKNESHFNTSSFYLSCFLFAHGLELVDISPTQNPRKKEFVFLDSPEREQLVQLFNFAPEDDQGVLVDARKFVTAIKTLKDRLYQQ